MARNGTGSTDSLAVSSPWVTDNPYTLSCWFYTADTSTEMQMLACGNGGASEDQIILQTNAGGIAIADQGEFGTYASATAGTYSASTWSHACGTSTGDANRTAYFNGTAGTTDTTDISSDPHNGGNFTQTTMFKEADNAPAVGRYFVGRLAEAAAWNVALTQAEISALAAGASPLTIRPGNLVGYAPLVSGLQDVIGGTSFTNTGTTVAAHAPITTYPRIQTFKGATAGGGTIPPLAVRHLQNLMNG